MKLNFLDSIDNWEICFLLPPPLSASDLLFEQTNNFVLLGCCKFTEFSLSLSLSPRLDNPKTKRLYWAYFCDWKPTQPEYRFVSCICCFHRKFHSAFCYSIHSSCGSFSPLVLLLRFETIFELSFFLFFAFTHFSLGFFWASSCSPATASDHEQSATEEEEENITKYFINARCFYNLFIYLSHSSLGFAFLRNSRKEKYYRYLWREGNKKQKYSVPGKQ